MEESEGDRAGADRLTKLGLRAWAAVGIAVLAAIVYISLASISGLVIPLVVAVVVGALFAPFVDLVGRYTGVHPLRRRGLEAGQHRGAGESGSHSGADAGTLHRAQRVTVQRV